MLDFNGSFHHQQFFLLHHTVTMLPLNREYLKKDLCRCMYRVSQKKRSFRISKPLGPTDASGDNSVGKGCWGDVG